MMEEKDIKIEEAGNATVETEPTVVDSSVAKKAVDQALPAKKMPFRKTGGGGRPPRRRADKPSDEFEQKIVDLARVTRVMAGGKRMKFRACMVIGDKNGRVGVGLAKGADVSMAISKSVTKAKKNIVSVPLVDGTIPHEVYIKNKSARIMLRPAKKGSGIKAGGVVRIVLELAGIRDVVAKIFGASNKINNANATILALTSFVPAAKESVRRRTGLANNSQPKFDQGAVKPRDDKRPAYRPKKFEAKKTDNNKEANK